MKKKILLAAVLFVCASNLFAYIYWEFDGVQPPSKKATIFHTIIAHENIKKVKGYSEYFNDCHNAQMKVMLDLLPPAKEYQQAIMEIVDIFCRNGKLYRVHYVTGTDNFVGTIYGVIVSSYDFGKDNAYSQSSLEYDSNSNASTSTIQMRQEYEQMHYSFNDMKNDFERLKSFYIDKL